MKFIKFILRVLIGLGVFFGGALISVRLDLEPLLYVFIFIGSLIIVGKDKAKNTEAAPKKKHGAWLWVAGGAVWICIMIYPSLGLLVGVVLGLALLPAVVSSTKSSTKNEMDQYLERRRSEIAADRRMWEENKKKEQRQRALRDEAERLENQARFWEREAAKTGRQADAQKARDYRNMARDAWKKV